MAEKKLSIVQIIDTLHPGGAERVLVTLSNLLHQHGHTVKVVALLAEGNLAKQLDGGIVIKALHRQSKWNPVTMYKLIKECRDADIVQVHSSHNLRYLFLASKLFFLNKTIYFHEHFGNIEIDDSVHWHQKIIYPSVRLIAVSRRIYDWAIDKLKIPKEHVFLLSNIVTKHKTIPKVLFDENDKRIKLVLVSNFRPTKNIEFAVELMNELRHKKAIHLTIVGQTADKSYHASIIQQIEKLQLQEHITLIYDCDNVQSILPQFDLALHVAKSESGPLVLIEYMMMGLPFLSYRTGEVIHQITDDLSNCIVDDFDMSNWMERINSLLQEDKSRLSQKLIGTYQKYYSEDAYYKTCMEIYDAG